jgi:LmbE family N-acetylglucosaminyl deacetylase
MRTVVFFHAHPDDEAIFTGGTMSLLADRGDRVVLVLATSGEQGMIEVIGDGDLGTHRRGETDEAAALLGVEQVLHLGYEDSGLDGSHTGGFAHVPAHDAAARAGELLDRAGVVPDALVIYDGDGIYDHPDHVAVHHAGRALAELVEVGVLYEATVDREYLHFVETHLVVEAGLGERPADLGLAATAIGRPTLLIDTELDVSSVIDRKRAAMAAHRSQIPESSSALRLEAAAFGDVYGFEWYVRHGPPGPVESLLPS